MKPILFNTEMVRAILAGRKTVTRRVVKPQPLWREPPIHQEGHIGYWATWDDEKIYKSPYRPGDILYVRETWKQAVCDPGGGGYALKDLYLYKTDEPIDTAGMDVEKTWHPSIHMPREAARIFLRVTDVRVERLQDITELDILKKEGVTVYFPQPKPSYMSLAYVETRLKPAVRKAFADLWDSTIKKADRALYGWAANPYVWCVSFERISKEEAEKDV